MKQHKRISKMMSLILRHKPEFIRATLDNSGWLLISELIEGIKRKGLFLDEKLLFEIVKENDKQRFVLSDDKLRIRANQGHSLVVDLALEQKEPPELLYHGTVAKYIESIKEKGLLKMNRQHVHLSADEETAIKVGSRRGKAIILKVNAKEMTEQGLGFFQSKNGVWLTNKVATEFILF